MGSSREALTHNQATAKRGVLDILGCWVNQADKQRRGTLLSFGALSVAGAAASVLNLWAGADTRTVEVLVGVVALVAPIFLWFDRLSGTSTSTEESADESVQRMRLNHRSFLEHNRTERPAINPPVSLRPLGELEHRGRLDRFLASAETIASQVFIARIAESRNRCTVVLGDPGSGKSTLIRRLALQMADDYIDRTSSEVPLVLRLRDWGGDVPLRRWILEQMVSDYAIPAQVVNQWVSHDRCLLLLDGLDEVVASQRGLLVGHLSTMMHRSDGIRLLVSCRTSMDGLGDLFGDLGADQLAVLRPVSEATARDCVNLALDTPKWPARRLEGGLSSLRGLLEEIVVGNENLRGPSTLSLVSASTTMHARAAWQSESVDPEDAAAEVLRLGTEFFGRGNFEAAKETFLAASRTHGSRQRALAMMLIGACEALLGNDEEARTALQRSIDLRLAESVDPPAGDDRAQSMDNDQRSVLLAMNEGVEYSVSQLSSRTLLAPSRVVATLTGLRSIGAVEVLDVPSGDARWQRTNTFGFRANRGE